MRLSSLKGTARLAVLTKTERWEIDLKATPKAEKEFKSGAAQVKIRLESVTPRANGNGWTLNVVQERKAVGTPRIFKTRERNGGMRLSAGDYSSIQRAFHVLNEQGSRIHSGGLSSNGTEANGVQTTNMEISVGTNFGVEPRAAKSPPAKLIVDVPLELREIQIPFEFKDLPLP